MAETSQAPGQPFTFSGVARYASARFSRLLGAALLFAILPAAVMLFLAGYCWWPVLTEAVGVLPETGSIQDGALHTDEKEARLLSANQFLSIQLAPGDLPDENAPVDFAVAVGRFEIMISSLFGDLAIPYPERWNIRLDRSVVWPRWGAWKGPILALFGVASALGFVGIWFALALIYAPAVFFLGGIAGREVNFGGAWKMSVAAQWPASLLMTFALALYASGEIGLLFVIIMFFAHFAPTGLNLLIAPFFLPKAAATERTERKSNPFTGEKRKKSSKANPFQSSRNDD